MPSTAEAEQRPWLIAAASRGAPIFVLITTLLCALTLAVGYANKARCIGPEFDSSGRSEPDYGIRVARDVCYSDSSSSGSAGTSTGMSSRTSTAATTRSPNSSTAAPSSTRCSPGWPSTWRRSRRPPTVISCSVLGDPAGGRRPADRGAAGLAGRAAVVVVRAGAAAGALRLPQLGPVRGLRHGGRLLRSCCGPAGASGTGTIGRPGPLVVGGDRARGGCGVQDLSDDVRAADGVVAGRRRLAAGRRQPSAAGRGQVAGRRGVRGRHRAWSSR